MVSQIETFNNRRVGGRMFYVDSFVIAAQYVRNTMAKWIIFKRSTPDEAFASVFMHELGHTLGLFGFPGIDNIDAAHFWHPDFWRYANYKSCMNYRYVYKLIDYSNGDDDKYDQNDWAIIDLARFESNG
jgi:hypothetical protein